MRLAKLPVTAAGYANEHLGFMQRSERLSGQRGRHNPMLAAILPRVGHVEIFGTLYAIVHLRHRGQRAGENLNYP